MIKKIIRLGTLLTIKESYLLAKNTFGLGAHPFKTLRVLQREKDRSQELLIFGWPMYVLVLGAGVVWLGRRLLGTSAEWGWGAKTTSGLFLLLSLLLMGYLIFWGARVWRRK